MTFLFYFIQFNVIGRPKTFKKNKLNEKNEKIVQKRYEYVCKGSSNPLYSSSIQKMVIFDYFLQNIGSIKILSYNLSYNRIYRILQNIMSNNSFIEICNEGNYFSLFSILLTLS